MKWYRLVPVMFLGVLLLGSMLAPPPPALAQISNTLQDSVPGSFLVFPIFDVITAAAGTNRTKIRITNNGVTGVGISVTYICQPTGSVGSGTNFCNSFDEHFPITHNQTIVLDVGTQLFGACPTGQGYVVVWAELQCPASGAPCPTATGGTISPGAFGPISYNQLYGSYHLYYNGAANPAGLLCGSVSCSPPAVGAFPDVEAANAIAIQSNHPAFSLLGNETIVGMQLTFGTTTAFDYVALPRTVQTDFATPGAPLIAGPVTGPDTISGTELQTNVILLNLDYSQFGNLAAAMSVNAWNWFEIGFTSTHRFLCWERIPINLIDPRINLVPVPPGPFGTPYGNIRFTPSPSTGPTSPQLLGALEEVSSVGRTIRNMIHSSTSLSPTLFVGDLP